MNNSNTPTQFNHKFYQEGSGLVFRSASCYKWAWREVAIAHRIPPENPQWNDLNAAKGSRQINFFFSLQNALCHQNWQFILYTGHEAGCPFDVVISCYDFCVSSMFKPWEAFPTATTSKSIKTLSPRALPGSEGVKLVLAQTYTPSCKKNMDRREWKYGAPRGWK